RSIRGSVDDLGGSARQSGRRIHGRIHSDRGQADISLRRRRVGLRRGGNGIVKPLLPREAEQVRYSIHGGCGETADYRGWQIYSLRILIVARGEIDDLIAVRRADATGKEGLAIGHPGQRSNVR